MPEQDFEPSFDKQGQTFLGRLPSKQAAERHPQPLRAEARGGGEAVVSDIVLCYRESRLWVPHAPNR